MSKPLNIGMIGYGFMGRAHSNAYRQVSQFFQREYQPVLKACCARNEDKIKAFAENWGYESYETDWRKLIARKDIDLIDIGSPNNTHKEIVLAAAKAGKMILCEKPLAMNVAEGEEMVAAVEKAGVPNMVWFNYRRVPAIALAKQLVDEGRVGRPFHYRATYLQDWTIADRRAARRRGPVAARRRRGRLGRDRRPAGPFDRHGRMAQRPDRARDGRHRNLRQGARPRRNRQGAAGGHRRRLHVSGRVQERLDGHVREHPLRPRPQELQHLRAQRRGRQRVLRPGRSAVSCSTSNTPIPRPAQRSTATSPAGRRSTSPIPSIPT